MVDPEELNAMMYNAIASFAGPHTLADSIHAPPRTEADWVWVSGYSEVCLFSFLSVMLACCSL